MVQQRGLLSVIQTALLLEVSRERVYELIERDLLKAYPFFGHIYLSFDEVEKRRKADIKSGRPKRSLLKRVVVGLKAAAKTDAIQRKHGGYNAPGVRKYGPRGKRQK